jgi:hypothetical protein
MVGPVFHQDETRIEAEVFTPLLACYSRITLTRRLHAVLVTGRDRHEGCAETTLPHCKRLKPQSALASILLRLPALHLARAADVLVGQAAGG